MYVVYQTSLLKLDILQTASGYDEPYEYVIYLIGEEVPLNAKIDVKLRNPILKESWELRNDDIQLQEKIGSVSINRKHDVSYSSNRGPNLHWTSNYGIDIVCIGRSSCQNFI